MTHSCIAGAGYDFVFLDWEHSPMSGSSCPPCRTSNNDGSNVDLLFQASGK